MTDNQKKILIDKIGMYCAFFMIGVLAGMMATYFLINWINK